MANPRKFSEKIALLNQKQAEETARFEQIMKEVSDVTSRAASASSSVGASPTGGGGGGPGTPARPLTVKSAGASPPQSSGKHLHISLGNQFKAGGSLPNVNAENNAAVQCGKEAVVVDQIAAIHSIDFKTALSTLEEMQHNQNAYQQGGGGGTSQERSRSMGVGPMRSRPLEKRHDTSPYSGVPYLSPPLPETWRRTNSDSALHQSANEACQSGSSMAHRRDQRVHGGSNSDNRDSHHHHHHHHHHGFIERPRSSCEMPRVPGINVYPSSQPPGQQIPIGNNTGSLPDLSNVHFPSPLHTPLDQEEHSSGSPYSNNHLSVPVNHRFLHSCKQGLTLENNSSASQQDVRVSYSQQQQASQTHSQVQAQTQPQNVPGSTPSSVQQSHAVSHSPGHYVYQQQPHSPLGPQSPNASQAQVHQQNTQGQFNSLGSYRTSQMVNRPSPQSSPSLTFQESPLSYSNNPSAPSSPTGHHGPPNLTLDPQDQNVFINQVHADFEQFSMEWAQMIQQLEDTAYTLSTPLDEVITRSYPFV